MSIGLENQTMKFMFDLGMPYTIISSTNCQSNICSGSRFNPAKSKAFNIVSNNQFSMNLTENKTYLQVQGNFG